MATKAVNAFDATTSLSFAVSVSKAGAGNVWSRWPNSIGETDALCVRTPGPKCGENGAPVTVPLLL